MKILAIYFGVLFFLSTSVFGQHPKLIGSNKLTGFNNYTKWINKNKDNTIAANELLNRNEFVLNDKGAFSLIIVLPAVDTFWTFNSERIPSQNFIIEARDNDSGKEWKVYESFCTYGKPNWVQMKPISGNITLTCIYTESEVRRSLTYNYNTGHKESDQHLNYYLSKEQIQNFSELDDVKINAYKGSKSVSLSVIQNYDWIQNFEAPFEKVAKRLLEYKGLDLDSANETSSDLQIIINVNGTSEKKTISMKAPNGYLYTDVEVRQEIGFNGTIIFKSASKAYYVNDFNFKDTISPLSLVAIGSHSWVQNIDSLTIWYRYMFYRTSFLKSFGEMLINAFELDPVDFYLYASTDDNGWINFSALKLLGELHDTSAIDTLIHIFTNDESIWKRRGAINALGEIRDPRTFDILINALEDEDRVIRLTAGESLFNVLVEMRDPHAYDILIEALNATYPDIRVRAVNALGILDDQRAVEPLIHALDDESSGVVGGVVHTLGKLGDSRAVEPLIRSINKVEKNKDWSKWDRMALINGIIKVLGDFGDPRTIEYIIPLLKTNRLNSNAQEALIQLTGENMGDKYKDWIKWWNEHKSEYKNK